MTDGPFVSQYIERGPEMFCLTHTCPHALTCKLHRPRIEGGGLFVWYKPDPGGNCDHFKPREER